MYKDKEGKFKGDATCCFLRVSKPSEEHFEEYFILK